MATTVRELLVKLGVKADANRLRTFDSGLKSVRLGALAVVGAVTAMAGSIAASVVMTARAGDEAAKAAKRIGVTAEEMQELSFAAEQSGADMAAVEVALRRQAVAARDASKGTGAAADAYRKIGVSVRDSNGRLKPQLQLLEEAADGISGLTTETEKLAVANDIWGRGGARILPLLSQGSEEIRRLREQAQGLGFVLSEADAVAAEDFGDRMNELRKIATGLRNRIGLALIPTINTLAERFRDWFLANREVIDQRLDRVSEIVRGALVRLEGTVDTLRDAFERLDQAVQDGPGSWSIVFRQLGKVIASGLFAKAILSLTKLVPVFKAIGAAFLLAFSPMGIFIGAIAAGFAAWLLIVEDLAVFLRGGDSAIGRFFDSFERGDEILANARRAIAAVSGFLGALADAGLALAGVILGPVAEALGSIIPEFVTWENLIRGLDALMLAFVLSIELAFAQIADTFELATLALTDFDAFASEVFGRLGEMFAGFSGLFGDVGGPILGGVETVDRPLVLAPSVSGGFTPADPSPLQTRATGLLGLARQGAEALSASFGPRPALAGAGMQSVVVNQEGDTITIPTTATPAEVEAILARRDRARRIAAADAARGGDR